MHPTSVIAPCLFDLKTLELAMSQCEITVVDSYDPRRVVMMKRMKRS